MATVWSTSSWQFLDCQLKKSSPVCLIVHKFDSSSRMNSSPVLSDLEKNAWLSFKDVVKNLLRNTRASNYTEIVQKLLESYKALDCNMSIKLHFLHCHLATFRKILVLLATSKVSDFTKIWSLWKNVTRVDRMSIWWLTIAGASNAIVLKLNTPEKATNVNFYLTLHIIIALSFVKTW